MFNVLTIQHRILRRTIKGNLCAFIVYGLLLSQFATITGANATGCPPSTNYERTCGGVRTGAVIKNYNTDGQLLLHEFFFTFGRKDHHIHRIAVLPNTPAAGQISLIYADKNGDDGIFRYDAAHYRHTDPRIKRRSITSDCRGGGKCSVVAEKPAGNYIFVLVGFDLNFGSNKDHHVDEVGIFENDRVITAYFNDKNDDDPFKWTVHYAYVPRELLSQYDKKVGNRGVKGEDRVGIEVGDVVIRGFKFNFRSKDHHLKSIGIFVDPAAIRVIYADKNGDDPFDWEVRYAIVR